MMPQVDGLTACMRIREFSNVPIIMLTARSEDADKIIGLESGADDYITKPFNILELKARIRALLRRANAAPQQKQQPSLLTAGGITLDPEQRVAMKNGEIIELTAKEYDLIELLVRNPRRIYSRENLMDLVWGYTYAGDYRTVDVHIKRLREKIKDTFGKHYDADRFRQADREVSELLGEPHPQKDRSVVRKLQRPQEQSVIQPRKHENEIEL